MSAQRAIHESDDAANSNAAAGPPMILFFGRELVHTRQPAVIPAAAELWGVAGAAAACLSLAIRITQRLRAWRNRARGRRALASLDARLRRDIGINEIEVWRELNKPFWRE